MQRLRELGEDDLNRQLWLIQASLATQTVGMPKREAPPRSNELVFATGRDGLLQAALAAGDRLDKLAVRGNGCAAWIGLATVGKNQWSLVPTGTDLYDGLPGVALFLAYLGSVTGQDSFTGLARVALATLQPLTKPQNPVMQSIGGFSRIGRRDLHADSTWRTLG